MENIQPKNTYDLLSELLEPLRNASDAVFWKWYESFSMED